MRARLLPFLLSIALSASLGAQLTTPLDSATLAAFRWRSIGPANMSGRITDIEGVAGNPKIFYVAAATGGIWKTINAGTTFAPIFNETRVISMGDIAIAPSNPDIIYAGTGEEDSRNSISPGAGIYKSVDAGKTWKISGLEATQQIGRILVDPVDPNIVYVAALGHAWNSNLERGLYKSTDGGAHWSLAKFISPKAGFVDIAMDPADHNTLYASSWERVRGPYFLNSGGPGSALWKSTDAGATWNEIRGGGFPSTMKGRIGIAIAKSNPRVVYAWVEADTLPRPLARGERADTSKRQKSLSGVYRSADAGATWTLMFRNEPAEAGGLGDARPFYYSQIRVDPRDADRIYWMSSVFRFSNDGGKTARRGAIGLHTDWHAMWIDPADPDHFILGEDGGIGITYDRGGSYDFVNTMALGQFYDVSYDMQKPYRVCGGLQDNGSWCGPSRSKSRGGLGNTGAITNNDWFNIGGGDGFYTAQDPDDANIIYSESQGGNASRLDLSQNTRAVIMRGGGREEGSIFEDSLIIARGDTALPEGPQIAGALRAIRARAAVDSTRRYRFNWEAPFFLSPHSPVTIYMGGNRLLKSSDRGDHFFPISPDLSTVDSARIIASIKTTGGITKDNSGAETHGTITAAAESPIRPGILWVGTDDGNLWLSRNDGGAWTDITRRVPGVPRKTWVARIEPSHFDSATVYVAFDNHRENDFAPYVYVSNDFGQTFRSIAANLPRGAADYVHVIREDPENRNLLFIGTDLGAYVSTDKGEHWQRFMTGLPTVPVYDLRIHPRDRELIAGTHGRSIWITDIAPLEEMNNALLSRPAVFFKPKTAFQYSQATAQAFYGNKVFRGSSPSYGAELVYRLTSGSSRDSARIVITNIRGDTVKALTGRGGPGIHRVYWDLRSRGKPLGPAARRDSVIQANVRKQRRDSIRAAGGDTSAFSSAPKEEFDPRPADGPVGGGAPSAEGGGSGGRQAPLVEPGEYLATITVNGQVLRQYLKVERVGAIINPPDPPDGDDDDPGGGG